MNGDSYENWPLGVHATREGAEAHAAEDEEYSWVVEWEVIN